MKLADAQRLCALTVSDLERLLIASGECTDPDIEEILDVDVREYHVRFKVRFADDGSFEEGSSHTGSLFVSANNDISM